jgi:hypothetical protein
MIPPTAGGECSPAHTAAGSSPSPPSSLVQQSNGDVATSNNQKGKKAVSKPDIVTFFPEIKVCCIMILYVRCTLVGLTCSMENSVFREDCTLE